jgi:RNA polymerase sigma-70 factor (ECF subfamily)
MTPDEFVGCGLPWGDTFGGASAIRKDMSVESAPVPDQYRKLLRFVRRRVASAEDAEDLVQEVFVNVAASLEGRGTGSPTLAWLYTVARRRMVDEARRRGRFRTVPLALVNGPAAAESRYGAEVARALDEALGGMPKGQRRVVVERLLRGRSFAEIGRELGTSEEACRMRFMRGLQHLREEFRKEGLEP